MIHSIRSEDVTLQPLVEQKMFDRIKEILSQFWLPPHEMKIALDPLIKECVGDHALQTLVSGETKNIVLYVLGATSVLTITPFSTIHDNVLLREVYDEVLLPREVSWAIFSKNASLLHRLSLPRVLLINPCVLENFPVPRLCLSVGLLASYLRKYQKAEVRIVDMQIGSSVEEILHTALQLEPALIGMSISYGQKQIALSILKEIYQVREAKRIYCRVIVGNIIPASFPHEFLERYPDILIAYGEGEQTILKVIDSLNGTSAMADVPGLVYKDERSAIQYTPPLSVPVENIPLPALDTLEALARWRGALTLELSRGCQWNVCTFCPREHKASHWKTFTTSQIIEQFSYLRTVSDRFGIARHIFLADEEFVGGMNDGRETERIIDVGQTLIAKKLQMSFDAAARVDQVYSPKMDTSWHIRRMKMWHLCRQAGLDRLFMGIESGSKAQLRRYGKGIDAEHSVLAIRILSALGIPLRFGFITFDQLMIGLKDIKENIAFLERTDAYMKPVDVAAYGYEKLFHLLQHDTEFIATHSAQQPIYEGISYMLATMEVLIHSRYKVLLQNAEKRYGKTLLLDPEKPDSNMGRYQVMFVDDLMRDLSLSCQKWIDRHFGLAYTVKSLYKVAPHHEKEHLMHWMAAYRQMSFFLLKSLVYIFDEENRDARRLDIPIMMTPYPSFASQIEPFRFHPRKNDVTERHLLLEDVLNLFDSLVADENTLLETQLYTGGITDTERRQLSQVLSAWKAHQGQWKCINS